MYKKITTVAMVAAFAAMTASAVIIADYDYGTTADPTSSGWSYVGSGSGYADGFDNGSDGWTVVDGTTSAVSFYEQGLNAAEMSVSWTATFTVAVNADAALSGGGGVDNYYTADPSRQNDNALWIENSTAGYWYNLVLKNDASGNVLIGDGTTDFNVNALVTQNMNTNVSNFITFTLAYNGTSATLSDDKGSTLGTVATAGTGFGSDRMIFGAFSGGGQGSTTWDNVTLDAIPEPATMGMVVAFGGGMLFIRRKLMM